MTWGIYCSWLPRSISPSTFVFLYKFKLYLRGPFLIASQVIWKKVKEDSRQCSTKKKKITIKEACLIFCILKVEFEIKLYCEEFIFLEETITIPLIYLQPTYFLFILI